MNKKLIDLCPCCSQKSYHDCCEPYHLWYKNAATAEILMRSRYSAYALRKADYLIKTWHPQTLPNKLAEDISEAKWIELEIHGVKSGSQTNEAFVDFTARYRNKQGKAEKMHEISRFIKQGDHWFYVDGEFVN